MAQVKRGVFTLGEFKELLARRIAEETAGTVNMQSDQAMELINECLPRNMMLKRLFHEEKEGESIMDTKKLALRNSGKNFIIIDAEEMRR